jgi:murein DD-endopeptidase MepM/ murein hydrolase activator NlpD
MKKLSIAFILLIFISTVVCNKDDIDPPPGTRQECLDAAAFGDPSSSPYCLPYEVGNSYLLGQSYCSPPPGSHEKRFAYDFMLPMGTEIIAARAGEVVELREHYEDNDSIGSHSNMVCLRHDDESISLYLHMKHEGIDVEMGEIIPKGGHLGWSGNAGDTHGTPHLHFQVCLKSGMCSYVTGEYTLPINFSNADGVLDEAGGLILGESYTALPCE